MGNKTIFLSYCWTNMDIANEVDETLQSYEGIKVKRDKRELNYGEDIQAFMDTVRQTEHVILLISEEYLQSVNCMYEVSQLIKDYNYSNRITPIIVGNVSIYGAENRLKYAKYWNDRYFYLNEEIRKLSIEDNISLVKELKNIKVICSTIDEILGLLNKRQYYKLEQHKQNNFNDIFKALNMQEIPNIKDKEIDVKSIDYKYALHKLEDLSNVGAKRYSAIIMINDDYTKEQLKEFILKITDEIKKRKYYKNNMVKNRFLNKEADVVWLFIARDLLDINTANWICRTSWISKDLEDNYKPLSLSGNDSVEDVEIIWNEAYESYKKYYKESQGTKEEVLEDINNIIPKAIQYANIAVDNFEKYTNGLISGVDLIKVMQDRQKEVNDLYIKFTDIPLPPEDLKNYMNICSNIISTIDNMFLYYSERGINTWDSKSRNWQMERFIREFKETLPILEYEKKKIN